MKVRAYLSNISPLWPRARQMEALAAAISGFPSSTILSEDHLGPRERRAHRSVSLAARTNMLRPSTRKDGDVIVVASLAVLAWSEGDMLACVTAAAARGATIRVLDADLRIEPASGASVLQAALKAFAAGRTRQVGQSPGVIGAKASSDRRINRAKQAAESIKQAWGLREERTADLLSRAGITLNTAKQYLGSRPAAQKAQDGAAKRKSRRIKP